MKAALIAVATVLLAWLGWFLLASHDVPPKPVEAAKSRPADAPTFVTNEPAEIFGKAFWRQPGADDQIVHAERREWLDAGGLKKWQWFIAVDASPALLNYLRVENAFGLVRAPSPPAFDLPPAWFAFNAGEVDVMQSRQNRLRVIFSKSGKRLYATDSGGGFQAGATEAGITPTPSPAPPNAIQGRLPNTHPPLPVPVPE